MRTGGLAVVVATAALLSSSCTVDDQGAGTDLTQDVVASNLRKVLIGTWACRSDQIHDGHRRESLRIRVSANGRFALEPYGGRLPASITDENPSSPACPMKSVSDKLAWPHEPA